MHKLTTTTPFITRSNFRCVNAGHCPPRVVEAVQKQVATLDYAPTFNMGHPLAFEYAHRLTTELYPGKASQVCARPSPCFRRIACWRWRDVWTLGWLAG